jgi:transposase
VGTREAFGAWLDELGVTDAEFVVEGCTGWRYIAEELGKRGMVTHVAEPAEAAHLRGPKKRAKTDQADARHLRMLLVENRVPESWIPPSFVADIRALGRLYKSLVDTRREYKQRIHAMVFHLGLGPLGSLEGSVAEHIEGLVVPADIGVYLGECASLVDHLTGRIAANKKRLQGFSQHPGPTSLQPLWGVGPLGSVIMWSELGDTRRFSSSRQAVRFAGLDITVHESDGNRAPGRLTRQGSPTLRWVLVEAAHHSAKKASPDYSYYHQTRNRVGGSRAALSVARKITRRAHHILRNQGDEAWQPI